MKLTTTQAAEKMAEEMTVNGQSPLVYQDKIKALIQTRRLKNVSSTSRMMIDSAEVEDFTRRTRYVPDLNEMLALNPTIYRVSVVARRLDQIFDSNGKPLRTFAGVDYSDNPNGRDEIGGWEGVWPIKEAKADTLVADAGLLLASCCGYVAPGHIRSVIGWSPIAGRRYLHTQPAPQEVESFLGTGIWIDIAGGPISAFVAV